MRWPPKMMQVITSQLGGVMRRPCTVKGCGKQLLAKGFCQMHYSRNLRHGSPHNLTQRATPGDRFWTKVQKSDGCWQWTAYRDPMGYGRFRLNGEARLAHRVSWEMHNGSISPEDLCVLHKCDNPSCVNPDHLFLGDRIANVADMVAKGRHCWDFGRVSRG
jgi:hypothetical protein